MKKEIKFFLVSAMALAMSLSAMAPVALLNSMTVTAAEIETFTITPFTANTVTYLTVAPGSNETELRFSWWSDVTEATVYIREAGQSAEQERAIACSSAAINTGVYSHKGTVTGLQANTSYIYKVVGTDYDEAAEYTIKTGDPSSFSFFAVGDPQIGTSNVTTDTAGWVRTIKNSVAAFPNVSFMVSTGDQVETNSNASHYTGYLSPTELTGLPVSQAVGNHDSGNALYANHYNMPNVSTLGQGTNSQGDYWYTYGKTLFMALNSNTTSIVTHKTFMESAIAANPDVMWKVVVFHHSPYSEASHANDSDQISATGRRLTWTPVFDQLGIDVVLAGHDHSYTRTYQMLGNQPQKDQTVNENGAVVDPTGTVYFELNSASGSKYYSLVSTVGDFSAKRAQVNTPTISKVDVTDNSFTVTTYRVDTMAELDTYSMVKTAPVGEVVDKTALEEIIANSGLEVESNYTAETWATFANALASAKIVFANPSATQEEVDAAVAAIEAAVAKLVTYNKLVVSTDATTVRKGQYFNIEAGFEKVVSSNAAILTINYDADKYDFRGLTMANDVQEISRTNENGVLTITAMISDYNAQNLVKVLFSAKEIALANGRDSINVFVQYVEKDEQGVKTIKYTAGNTGFKTAGDLPPGTGEEGKYTLIDLSNVIDMFGFNSDMPNWEADYMHYDLNNDGTIDISDIATIARLIEK